MTDPVRSGFALWRGSRTLRAMSGRIESKRGCSTSASYANSELLDGASRRRRGVMLSDQSPERRDAISLEMWDGVSAALDRLRTEDEHLRMVIYSRSARGDVLHSSNDIAGLRAPHQQRRSSAESPDHRSRGRETGSGTPSRAWPAPGVLFSAASS